VLELNVFFLYISALYLDPADGKRAYDLFVLDIEVITVNSDFCDVILVLSDFNLPKIRHKESGPVMLFNVTTDLEGNLILG
jgi:hypothetical protein